MKRVSLIFLVVELALAGEHNGRGTKAIALSNAFVAGADNPWAVCYNPALLSESNGPEVSFFFVPEQFGLRELRTNALAVAIPVGAVGLGTCIERFGFDLYHETTFRIGAGTRIERLAGVGLAAGINRVAIERYGLATVVTVDAGLWGRPLSNVQLGFTFQNLLGARIGATNERLPQTLLTGFLYEVQPDIRLFAELEKEVRYPGILEIGLEKCVQGLLALRIGVSNNPAKFSMGIAVQYSIFEFGYAGYSHQELGWTHQIEMSLRFDE